MSNLLLSTLMIYNHDSSIFDSLTIPDTVDRPTLINKILADTAELSVIYSDPTTLKELIQNWSATRLDSWTRTANALDSLYNPIHNYDRSEEWEESGDNSAENTSASEREVSGYNDGNSLVPESALTDESSGSGEYSNARSGHISGNIGVTTTQHMIQEEIELREKFNIYQVITDSFKNNFCILVY